MTVYAEQPYRVETVHGVWPSGVTNGGWLCGDGDDCRAADIVMEDSIAPPLHCEYHYGDDNNIASMSVESTHAETTVWGHRTDGLRAKFFTFQHPGGLR